MSIIGQKVIGQRVVSHREESIEEVWAEFKEGILSTAVEVCDISRGRGRGQDGEMRSLITNFGVKFALAYS